MLSLITSPSTSLKLISSLIDGNSFIHHLFIIYQVQLTSSVVLVHSKNDKSNKDILMSDPTAFPKFIKFILWGILWSITVWTVGLGSRLFQVILRLLSSVRVSRFAGSDITVTPVELFPGFCLLGFVNK